MPHFKYDVQFQNLFDQSKYCCYGEIVNESCSSIPRPINLIDSTLSFFSQSPHDYISFSFINKSVLHRRTLIDGYAKKFDANANVLSFGSLSINNRMKCMHVCGHLFKIKVSPWEAI